MVEIKQMPFREKYKMVLDYHMGLELEAWPWLRIGLASDRWRRLSASGRRN